MKKTSLLISAVLLSLIAGVQTAMAQKVTLYSAGSKAYECDIARLDSIVFSEGQTIPAEEIVVTVDANGNADGEHRFEKIDEANFYIDDIKYTTKYGNLEVKGYNLAFFKGAANIISKLKYRGRTMKVVGIRCEAFYNCEVLTSVTIPNSVTNIDGSAFRDCSSLTSVTIGSGVTSIGDYVFSGCSSLTSITIPNSVTSIRQEAFSGCSGLTSIIVESGNTVYDSRNNCNAIIETATNTLIVGCKKTIIPGSVTSIGFRAFEDCSGLTSITIPESVTSIGNRAFEDCSGLTSITIGSGVTSIGYMAFYGCTSLTSITIPNSVASIGSEAFSGCTSLTSVTIPESVTSIGGYAFSGCSSLTSVTIPESVTSIGYKAFSGCSSLTSIIVESGNTVYDSRNNCNAIIETSTNTLIAGCMNTVIPESVTSIGGSAFYGCSSLTSVTIPNSVTSIDSYTFQNCSGLTSVTIPESVTSIHERAFYGCSGLTDVYCYAINVPSTSNDAFDESPIWSATLHVPAGSVDAYKAARPWSVFGSIVAIE